MTSHSKFEQRTVWFICFVIAFVSFGFSGVPGWSRLPLLAAGALLTLRILARGSQALIVPTWLVPIGLFLFVSCLASIHTYASSGPALLTVLSTWGVALALGLAISSIQSSNAVVVGACAAAVVNAIAIASGIESFAVEHAAQFGISEEVALRRPSGLVGNANLAAINAVLPLFMMLLFRDGAIRPLPAVATIAAATYIIYMTGSRKGVWFFALWAPVALVALPSGGWRRTFLISASAAVLIIVGLQLSTGLNLLNFLDGSETYRRVMMLWSGGDSSTTDRAYFFSIAPELFSRNPWVGYGLDQFKHVSGSGLYAHSTFLELAVGGGVALLVSYYAIMGALVSRCIGIIIKKKRPAKAAVICLLSAMAVISLDMGMVSFYAKTVAIFWVFALDGIYRLSRNSGSTHASDVSY